MFLNKEKKEKYLKKKKVYFADTVLFLSGIKIVQIPYLKIKLNFYWGD